jgi:hypothetical protein
MEWLEWNVLGEGNQKVSILLLIEEDHKAAHNREHG